MDLTKLIRNFPPRFVQKYCKYWNRHELAPNWMYVRVQEYQTMRLYDTEFKPGL